MTAALFVLQLKHDLNVQLVFAYMNDIVDTILQALDRDIGETAHGKVRNYINLLASTGKTDEQLVALGRAYLDEILNPNPRYSGC